MSDFHFRDATPDDISTILELTHAGDWRGADTPPLDRDSFADPRYRQAFDAISASRDQRLIVMEKGEEVIGTLQITFIPGLTQFGMWRGLLENVHVRPDQRGTGNGTKLVNWAIEQCRSRGCGMVQLTSNKARIDTHRFYEGLGFAKSHEGFKLML